MKNITIELTYDEVKAIGVLKAWDEEQITGLLHRKLYCKKIKENLAEKIETCMELLEFDGKVYKACKEALMEAWKEIYENIFRSGV